ncbi:MAG: hypothetical protein IJ789_06400 [Bacteroidales bacterium]|nr:hypothetical protein [Bacteroidales bacterium]
MVYDIEKITEPELLQMLIAIEAKRSTGFIDTQKAQQRIEHCNIEERKGKLAQILLHSQNDFSPEELLQYMQKEQTNRMGTVGVKIVHLSPEQQQLLNRNLNKERDDMRQALLDKYNTK